MVPLQYFQQDKIELMDPNESYNICPNCGSDKVFFVIKKGSKERTGTPRSDVDNLNSSNMSFRRPHSNSHPENTVKRYHENHNFIFCRV